MTCSAPDVRFLWHRGRGHGHCGTSIATFRSEPLLTAMVAQPSDLQQRPVVQSTGSVLARDRSISFCRFLTLGQSCSCAAAKIRCRSRRTRSSCARQSIRSRCAGAVRGWSSGPFAIRAAAVTSVTAGATRWPPSQTGVEKL